MRDCTGSLEVNTRNEEKRVKISSHDNKADALLTARKGIKPFRLVLIVEKIGVFDLIQKLPPDRLETPPKHQ